jgi:IS1 family transposase
MAAAKKNLKGLSASFLLDAKHKSSYRKGMNKLPLAKRVQVLQMLCEGMSMRAISRTADVSFVAVAKMLADAGEVCLRFHDQAVRNLQSQRVQCDEVWAFCAAKAKNVPSMKRPVEGAGDVWTWTAIDADSKLIISYHVGTRDLVCAKEFINDLAGRLDCRVQLTSDGWVPYLAAVGEAFRGRVDFAQLQKIFASVHGGPQGRYSPGDCIGTKTYKIIGNPEDKHISTSYVERSHLSLRMHNRRFTRLTNAFSKKFISHVHMVALYTVFYNFIRIHKTLRTTPAMAAGLMNQLMSFEDIAKLIDAATPAPNRPKVYKKKPMQIAKL